MAHPSTMIRHVDQPQSACRFAIARADITPPVGIYHRMWGAATHQRSEGVHRPLLATVLMFSPLEERAAQPARQVLVALDHCLFGQQEMDNLLDQLAESAGLQRREVVVTFSHTHGAGLMLLDRQSLPGGELIADYLRHLNDVVAGLANRCQEQLQAARLIYGQGRCGLASARDLWDEQQQQFVCGFDPSSPADDTLLVARAVDMQGNTLATIVNYACHPTTLAWENRLISPDYPGAMRELIEQATAAPCVFLQGASGDLGPKEGFVGDLQVADRNGRQLGYAALSALEALPPPGTRYAYRGPVVSGATIGVWSHTPLPEARQREIACWRVRHLQVGLPYQPDLPSREQVLAQRDEWRRDQQSAEQAGNAEQARDCHAMAERCDRLLARLAMLPAGDTFPYQVAMWRMGDAVWVAVQGEPYNLLQTELRRRFPELLIVVVSLSHHWGAAYLPPAELYGKGIYQESIAVLAPGCLEQVIEQTAQSLVELNAER